MVVRENGLRAVNILATLANHYSILGFENSQGDVSATASLHRPAALVRLHGMMLEDLPNGIVDEGTVSTLPFALKEFVHIKEGLQLWRRNLFISRCIGNF